MATIILIGMSKQTSPEITSTRTVYRIVNGKRKRFVINTVATQYKPTPNTIGYKCGRVKNSNGKVDPTMILASHNSDLK